MFKLAKFLTDFFRETNYVFIDLSNVKVPFLKE